METATLKDPPAFFGREVESEELPWNQENRMRQRGEFRIDQDYVRVDANLLSSSKRQLMQHMQSCHLSVVCETPLHQSGRFRN